MEYLKPWTVTQLYRAMTRDLLSCHSEFERNNVRAIGGKEIRELAESESKSRRLTPFEIAIAESFGYRATA